MFSVNRAINYDEKDPFLCHACGFCKYAKFDYTLTGRACCAVDPIESDDDRKKTVGTINSLLEKADRVYKQLIANKPTLEVSTVKKVILNPCICSLFLTQMLLLHLLFQLTAVSLKRVSVLIKSGNTV